MRRVNIPRQVSARSMMLRLPYYDTVPVVPADQAALTYMEYVFNVNSVYDPDSTGTGHQPRGYDQYAGFYNAYIVRGFSYNIMFRATSIGDNESKALEGLWGIHFGGPSSAALFNSVDDFMERPRDYGEKYKHWTKVSTSGAQGDGQYQKNPGLFKGYVSCKKLKQLCCQGLNWPKDFTGVIGADPTNLLQLVLWVSSLPQGTGSSSALVTLPLCTIACEVRFVYYVEFIEPRELVNS